MPHDLDVRLKRDGTPRKSQGGRRQGQSTARDITNVNALKALTRDTRVAPNLWLQVRGGSKSWRMDKWWNGKRFQLGLGPFPEVSLVQAKAKVFECNAMLARGEDPRKPIVEHRFRDVVPLWIEKERPSWTSARYKVDTPAEIARYATPILGDMDVAAIDTPDVVDVLMQLTENDHPLWLDKHKLAFRLKGFIAQVLGYAMAMKWRKPGFNAAAWTDNLQHVLADPKSIHTPESHASLHHSEIGGFMQVLRSMDGIEFRCLELLIHTAVRSNEMMGTRRDELDLAAGLWRIPAPRMKKRKEHVVPLSRQAIALFRSLPKGTLVFGELDPEALRGAVVAVMAKAARQWFDKKTAKLVVPHGFRASFATWAAEHGYEDDLIDIALAHTVASETLRRYQRSEKAELRRVAMQGWSDHLDQ